MKSINPSPRSEFTFLLSLAWLLAEMFRAQAQPTIKSTVPANGATGVSVTTTVVFTFSAAMNTDTNVTEATFLDMTDPINPILTSPSWSVGNTMLTCTPLTSFPANKTITWFVSGESAAGDPLAEFPLPYGTFTTGTGGSGGGGGSGTNAITSFVLGKNHSYHQTSTGAPTLDTSAPYSFSALTSLSSNRTATSVSLTLPTSGVSNLAQNPYAHEDYSMYAFNTDPTTFEATFPYGTYTFNVQATTSNQIVNVTFPTTNVMAQPGAPHVTNYTAAQAVNPTQPFVLAWDAFPGGGSTDFVYVTIGNVFSSTNAGSPGALSGTATALTIPAGTLQPGSNYDSSIGFFRHVATTNGNNYFTTVYRATLTDFTLTTGSGSELGPLVLTNASYAPANFSFDVLCSPGQTVTVDYRANLTAGQWQPFLTTNSPGSSFRAVAPQSTTNRILFFRARNGT